MKSIYFSIFLSIVFESFSLAQVQPVKLPIYSPPFDPYNTNNGIIYYNYGTHEKVDIIFDNEFIAERSQVLPFVPDSLKINNEINVGGSREESNFSSLTPSDQLAGFPGYPFSTIVKIILTFYSPTYGTYYESSCSGALINDNFVITAGHCVTNPFTGDYTVSATIIPEYNLGNSPFGSVDAISSYWFTQWSDNANYNFDLALIELSEDIGYETGWLGFGPVTSDGFLTATSNIFNCFGYPAQDDFGNTVYEGGERMYYMYGYMDFFQDFNIPCHNNIGYHGQSGSAFYYKDDTESRYVYGVLSHGNGVSYPYNTCYTKINTDIFYELYEIIDPVTTIETSIIENDFSVFPNPCNESFNINTNTISTGAKNMSILTILGESVLELQLQTIETEIDIRKLESGIYILKVGDFSTKLVIIH